MCVLSHLSSPAYTQVEEHASVTWQCSCALHLQVEMRALSINLNSNSKKGQKTLCYSLSSCLRNLHVKPRQKKSIRKQSSCLYSVKILSVPIWSSALPDGSKAGDPTQSISLQGQQHVCEQTSTSHDRAQCTLYTVAWVLKVNSTMKSLIVLSILTKNNIFLKLFVSDNERYLQNTLCLTHQFIIVGSIFSYSSVMYKNWTQQTI